MALIGRIQKNSVLLLIVIGGAMLAFIFTDMMGNSGGGGFEQLPLATVYDDELDDNEYNDLRQVYVDREKDNAAAQNQPFTPQAESQAEDQAFNEVIRRNLMEREFDKLEIICTVDELNDMIHGNHIHPWVQQIPLFTGFDGQFSRDSVRNFLNQLQDEPEGEEAIGQWQEAKTQWRAFEEELKDTRKADKYVALIKKGIYVNSLESKHTYTSNNEMRTVRFVVQRYTDIPFDEIEVTDEEIKAFYDEHKSELAYEMQEARDIDFVSFPIVATAADIEAVQNEMNEIKVDFEASENNISFISAKSNSEFAIDTMEFRMGTESLVFDSFYGNNQYPAVADDAIQESKIGDVVGPFMSFNAATQVNEMFIAKVTGVSTEKQAWVRHILIKVDATRGEEEAKAMSDSIINVIKEQDNFVEMVQTVSEDPGSIAANGEYKWFAEGRMVAEFNDASFNGAIGQLQLVKTTYGFHIVEVLGRGDRVVPKLGIVTKEVKPSENTLKFTEERVFDFIYNVGQIDNDSAFYMLAADSSMDVLNNRIAINQTFITGMVKTDKMMKFGFGSDAIEGNISDPILDDGKYVVGYIANVIEEGEPEFEDVIEQMRFPALKDKQAKIYMDKMNGKSSLEDVASAIKNGAILTAQITYGANVIAGAGGNEPEVIGSIFRDKITKGVMTIPIQGRSGVYVCVIDNITEAPETTDYTVERDYLRQARQGSADNLVIRALREKADVQDNRRKIRYQ